MICDSSMQLSGLLDLPTELRTEVYQLVFNNQAVRELDLAADDDNDNAWQLSMIPSILLTCRTIYMEAKQVFYSTVTFIIGQRYPREAIEVRLGDNIKSVRHVVFRGQRYDVLDKIETKFSSLQHLKIELEIGMTPSDQMHVGRAVRDIMRYNGSILVFQSIQSQSALLLSQIIRLQELGRSGGGSVTKRISKRGFTVTLRWGLDYRFLDFRGYVDIDEWILHFWKEPIEKKMIYSIPQAPLKSS